MPARNTLRRPSSPQMEDMRIPFIQFPQWAENSTPQDAGRAWR